MTARAARKLTPKQQRFCEEYIVDLNATQAAVRAGYSAKTARQIASELLTKPDIEARIAGLRQMVSARTSITRERIEQEYGRLAFFDIRKAFTSEGVLLPIQELDDDTAAAIAAIDITENQGGAAIGGEAGIQHVASFTKKIKLADKKAALDSLSRMKGLFIDKVEHTGKNGTPLVTETPLDEAARRIAFLLSGAVQAKPEGGDGA